MLAYIYIIMKKYIFNVLIIYMLNILIVSVLSLCILNNYRVFPNCIVIVTITSTFNYALYFHYVTTL